MKSKADAGAIYGLGFVGALVYFLQHSSSFMDGVVGFFLAVAWPAVVFYKALELLKM